MTWMQFPFHSIVHGVNLPFLIHFVDSWTCLPVRSKRRTCLETRLLILVCSSHISMTQQLSTSDFLVGSADGNKNIYQSHSTQCTPSIINSSDTFQLYFELPGKKCLQQFTDHWKFIAHLCGVAWPAHPTVGLTGVQMKLIKMLVQFFKTIMPG